MTDFIKLLYAKNNKTLHTEWLHWSCCAILICFSYLPLEIPNILKFIVSVMGCFANCLIMPYEFRRNNSIHQTFCRFFVLKCNLLSSRQENKFNCFDTRKIIIYFLHMNCYVCITLLLKHSQEKLIKMPKLSIWKLICQNKHNFVHFYDLPLRLLKNSNKNFPLSFPNRIQYL